MAEKPSELQRVLNAADSGCIDYILPSSGIESNYMVDISVCYAVWFINIGTMSLFEACATQFKMKHCVDVSITIKKYSINHSGIIVIFIYILHIDRLKSGPMDTN